MKRLVAGLLIGLLLGLSVAAYAGDVLEAVVASFPILVNGKAFTTDKPIVTINGSTYMPLRAIGDALGVKVNWNSELKRVEIGDSGAASSGYSYSNPAPLNTTILSFRDKFQQLSILPIILGMQKICVK